MYVEMFEKSDMWYFVQKLVCSLPKQVSKFLLVFSLFLFMKSTPRTATEMDGTLHTDFRKSETSRDIKKYF